MKSKLYLLLICSLSLLLTNCGDSSSAGINADLGTEAPEARDKPNTQPAPAAPKPTTQVLRSKHDCKLMGKVLDGNQHWIAEEELLLAVVADTAQMYDKDHPNSHHSFQVYDTKICDLIGNHVMPVNKEPDYPYYLCPNTYEPTNQVVCAQGGDFVYCFDLARKEMLLPLIPEYLGKRRAIDANSGVPQGLATWDQYLFGYAADYGCYAFDLSNKKQVKNLLPTAEFLNRGTGSMNQLFMVQKSPGNYQAAYTSFDIDAGEDALQIKPLFASPLPIISRLSSSARNNNLLVFKYKDGSSSVGIDMEKGKSIDLPSEVATKSVQEILAWMRTQ